MEFLTGPIGSTVLTLYYAVLGVLALFGAHRAYLVALYFRHRDESPATPPEPTEWPIVTVQLPLYNEMYVVRRLVEAVCRFDYPRDRLEIQILDDSTDETRTVAAELVEEFRQQGFDLHHLHRENREGYKAGALEAGLAVARGNLIAVFDADFIPPERFLRDTVPYFSRREVGMVQACWEHLNRDYSLLTRVQAIFLDGHFRIEHTARNRSGCFFNFNGTAGIWRRAAIEEAGGWQHDTLTEDLDLSYRAQLAGWQFLYLPKLGAPSELPVDIHGFKAQQHRWAKGSVQTGRKLLPRLLRAPIPLRVKIESLFHLTNNLSYVLMIILSLLVFPAMLVRHESLYQSLLFVDLPLFLAATGSVLMFYIVSQIIRGKRWLREAAFLPALMGLGIGLSVNNASAVISGLVSKGGVFHRTPKYSIVTRRQEWKVKRYRAGKSLSFLIEGALATYLGICLLVAVYLKMWLSLPFLYLFFHGYSYMFLLSILPNRPRRLAPLRAH